MGGEPSGMGDTRCNWHEDVFFGIHYDLHAGAQDTALGKELTPEHLRERLLRVQPDWIQCDCKGHAGYTSWPTEVGSTSPGVVKDALRIHRDVTRELGIKLGVHYSGVWDSRAIELHPEWACVDAEGNPNPNMTCRLSGYDSELMIPQMLEIIDKYDVDGFWVDGENWAAVPCWCDRCRAEFTRRTGIAAVPTAEGEPHWEEWLAFHRDLFVEHVTAYATAVHARKPDCLVCSNWMYTVRQPDPVEAPVDYLSGDYDWVWGANRAAVEGRLLDGRGITWDLMAWGFLKTGEMGGPVPWCTKTATHLCQELAEVVALGGAVMVYDNPQRTGWITGWHQEIIAEAARFCRLRKDVCFKSRSVPQVALLHLADHYYSCNQPLFNYGAAVEPLEGALHALLETHHSVDIVTEQAALERMGEYKLVVVPEHTRLSEAIQGRLESFARSGGHVVISGENVARDFPGLVGARPASSDMSSQPGVCYVQAGQGAVGMFGPWQAVEPEQGTEVWVRRMTQQEPEKDTTEEAVVTYRPVGQGSVLAIHGPVFRNYFHTHYPLLRKFLGDLFRRLGISWKVTLDAPHRIELILREKDGNLVVNLVNRGAGEMTMGTRVVVDEIAPATDVKVRVRMDRAPGSVRAVPEDPGISWLHHRGVLEVLVPRVDIHLAVVVEPGAERYLTAADCS